MPQFRQLFPHAGAKPSSMNSALH